MPEDLREAFAYFNLTGAASLEDAEALYRTRARRAHPDAGGNAATMRELIDAITVLRSYLRNDDDIPF